MFFSGNSSWEDSFFPFSLPPFWSSQEVEKEPLVFPRHTSFFSCDYHLLLCSLLVEFLHHIAHLLHWVFHFSFERACTLSRLEQYFWYLDFRLAIWFVKCKGTSLSLSCSFVLPVTRWPAKPSAMLMNVDITTLDFRKAKEQIQRIKFEVQVWFLTSSFTNGRLAAASLHRVVGDEMSYQIYQITNYCSVKSECLAVLCRVWFFRLPFPFVFLGFELSW